MKELVWLLAAHLYAPLLVETPSARESCASHTAFCYWRLRFSILLRNWEIMFFKCSLTFGAMHKSFFAVLVAYFIYCFGGIMQLVYLCWIWMVFHLWKETVLSMPLYPVMWLFPLLSVCYVNVSGSYLSWHDSFRLISDWMILAKQEFEAAYLLATGITNLSWFSNSFLLTRFKMRT